MNMMEEAIWSNNAAARGVPLIREDLLQRPGRVTLIGAGPGDPELLTLRAVKALRNASIVLYDHLVSDAVLEFVREDADLIYVGKQSRRHSMPQEQIIELMVELALSGQNVARLKGGDGYIFGRGGEEAQALCKAGIPLEVVPGISAAQGAAAYAGIPLTHRDHAATLVYATGHLRGDNEIDLDWSALARPRQTVVFYMGIGNLKIICTELQRHGLPSDVPAALVENATLPQQRCVCGTLATLPEVAVENDVRSPALIIVGHVVSLQPVLSQAGVLLQPAVQKFREV